MAVFWAVLDAAVAAGFELGQEWDMLKLQEGALQAGECAKAGSGLHIHHSPGREGLWGAGAALDGSPKLMKWPTIPNNCPALVLLRAAMSWSHYMSP